MSGLERRYFVTKANDPSGVHADCRYFVLDPQHDPTARAALRTYAAECDDDALADDLMRWLADLDLAEKLPANQQTGDAVMDELEELIRFVEVRRHYSPTRLAESILAEYRLQKKSTTNATQEH